MQYTYFFQIFFPRSVAQDAGYRHKAQTASGSSTQTQSIHGTPSIPSSYYPPGISSPTYSTHPTPTYPPTAATSPTSTNPPPFLFRSSRRSINRDSIGSVLAAPPPSEVLSPEYRDEMIPDPDDDTEEAPSYFDSVGMHRRHRRSSTGKGVEFDLPEEDEDQNVEDDEVPLPRLVRRETVPGSTARYVGREMRSSRHTSGASSSTLHPYVRPASLYVVPCVLTGHS